MEDKQIRLFEPFNNIGTQLRAMQIIKTIHSQKADNIPHVVNTINKLLNLKTTINDIRSFIELIEHFPTRFGYDFILETMSFQNNKEDFELKWIRVNRPTSQTKIEKIKNEILKKLEILSTM